MIQKILPLLDSKKCLTSLAFITLFTATVNAWTLRGPGGGGQVYMMELDTRTSPPRLYLGTDVTGLFRSTNEGGSWNFLNTGGIRYVQDWHLNPSASGNTDNFFITARSGVWRTTDNGSTWSLIGNNLNDDYVSCLSIVKNSTGNVFYAGIGNTRRNDEGVGGIWKKNPTSNNWIFKKIKNASGTVLAGNDVVYNVIANPANVSQVWAAAARGIYYSADGGTTWSGRNSGLPSSNRQCRSLLINPSNFQRAYTLLENEGVYFWNGSTWSSRKGGLPNKKWKSLAWDKTKAFGKGLLVADDNASEKNIYYTADATVSSPTWSTRKTTAKGPYPNNPTSNPHSTALHGNVAYIGKNGTTYRMGNITGNNTWNQIYSNKSGSFWKKRGEFENTHIAAVAVDKNNNNTILTGKFDRGIWRSTDGGVEWNDVTPNLDNKKLSSVLSIAWSANNTVYCGGKTSFSSAGGGSGVFRSTNDGASWSKVSGYNQTNNEPFGMAADSNGNLFVASKGSNGGVWFYNGSTWSKIGLNGQACNSVAVKPGDNNVILVSVRFGTTTRGVWRGNKSGSNWTFTRVLDKQVDCWSVVFDPTAVNTAYAAMGTKGLFKLFNNANGAYRGNSKKLSAAAGGTIDGVAMSADGRIYAASSGGSTPDNHFVKVSNNKGNNWQDITDDIPSGSSREMTFKGNRIYVGTTGNGVWSKNE